MTEEQLIDSYKQATAMHANDGAESGLHPMHIANILLIASLEISVQFGSVAETRAGLLMAADNIGKDGVQ